MKKILSIIMPAAVLMLFSFEASARCAALAYDALAGESAVTRDCELTTYQRLQEDLLAYEGGTGGGTPVTYSCSNPANGYCSSCNSSTGICKSVTCNTGYYASGTTCVTCSNISVSNGTCTSCSSSGTCTAVSCNTNYSANGTSCVKNVAVVLPTRFSKEVNSCPTGMTKSDDGCCCVNKVASIVSFDDLVEYEFIPVATAATFSRSARLQFADFIAE